MGDPKPNITWFRNGDPVVPTRDMVVYNYTLKLNKLLPKHSGNYSCLVTNNRGSINHTFTVRIEGKK